MMEEGVSVLWIIAAANVLVVVPLILLLIQASRKARAGWLRAEAERIRSQENEHRLRSVLEAEPQGILVLGLDCRVLQVNPAGRVLFDAGFTEEIVGKDLRDSIHANDCLRIEEMLKAAREGRETCGKGRLIGLSGQSRWIEITCAPLPADDGTVQSVLSVLRDVTEEKRGDRRQTLQHAVAKVLAEASTVEQAIPELLRAIAVSSDWHVGLFWRVQEDRRSLHCVQAWSGNETALQEFLRLRMQDTYISGSGLPGRSWARGEPLWVEDIEKHPGVVPGSFETTRTLHAACVFPVWLRANVYGVMEFFGQEAQSQDWDLLKTLGTIGSQIGLFIERAEVEAAPHENETRTRLIIDTAHDARIPMDHSRRNTE